MNSRKIFITYPYNEILPRKKAHDVFVFQECAALHEAGFSVTLLCGKGSLPDHQLFEHYSTPSFPIKRLPIIRKNNPFNISWNLPFFFAAQKELKGTVILSVLKQAAYHLKRKLPNTSYIYEVHQLTAYDGNLSPLEKFVFENVDHIVVTTEQLKHCIPTKTPISVIPLAVNRTPLPPIEKGSPFVLTYVGQLYKGQGVEQLLQAAKDIELRIVGGTPSEIEKLKPLNPKAKFYGFCSPSQIEEIVRDSHAFVAPFELTGRMPYVAHTKLYEYANWKRPFIAPDAPIVHEHLPSGGVYFRPGKLSEAIEELQKNYKELQQEALPSFTWKARSDRYQKLLA